MLPQKRQSKDIYIPPGLRKTEVNTDACKNKSNSNVANKKLTDYTVGLEEQLKQLCLIQQVKSACDIPDDNVRNTKSENNTNKSSEGKRNSTLTVLSNSNQLSEREPNLNYENYRHILEFHNFTKEAQTFQLEAELNGFKDSGFYLKWVDDVHCLAVFSSNDEASRALLQISGIFMKARRIPDASLASKWKLARSPGDWAMPYKKRPPTTSITARRMISNHLGIRNRGEAQIVRENEENMILREARARAEAIRKAQKAMWEDD